MKLDQETLSRNRFWVLFGIMVPLLLVCMLWLTTSVADTNLDKVIKLNQHKVLLDQKAKIDLKGKEFEKLLVKRAGELEEQRLSLWQQASAMQTELVVWPKELQAKLGKLEFGDDISTDDCGVFANTKIYQPQIDELAGMFRTSVQIGADSVPVESVRLRNGPENVLKYVKQWKAGSAPAPSEVWMAQEDIWVQKELLRSIQEANNFVARFQKVEKDPQGKAYPTELGANDRFRAHFQNPYWHIDLILTEKAAGFTLKGTLQNRPDSQRQLPIGRIYFAVQVSKDPTAKPVILPVEGEALAPGGEWPIREFPLQGLVNPEGIMGVTQVYGVRDAPVRQINDIRLSYPAHRLASKELLPIPRGKEAPTAPPPKVDPRKSDGGPAVIETTENGLIKKRYTEAGKEVRRMPIGIELLVDQAHIPEVLTALANSRLRVQVTQIGWQHYTGGLSAEPGAKPAAVGADGRPPVKGAIPEDQKLTNVVELVVYGTASVYERFPEKPAPPPEPAKQ